VVEFLDDVGYLAESKGLSGTDIPRQTRCFPTLGRMASLSNSIIDKVRAEDRKSQKPIRLEEPVKDASFFPSPETGCKSHHTSCGIWT
jgi:hypothetical protein